MDLVNLPEWTFGRKRISANSRLYLKPNLNFNPNSNSKRNTKAHKLFRENKITSFFGQVSRYHKDSLLHNAQLKTLLENLTKRFATLLLRHCCLIA